MTRDRIEVVHIVGGASVQSVIRQTGADFVVPAGFLGEKTIQGRKVMYGVDLTISNGTQLIGPHFPDRKVFAVYRSGLVRIASSASDCFAWGMPEQAVAGMTVPPNPNMIEWRQFWAIKGNFLYWNQDKGTGNHCQRIAQQWGYESMVHMDGGSTLEDRFSASFIVIYRDGLIAGLSKQNNALGETRGRE